MDRGQTSFDLLAHFDRPKTVALPDFAWVDEVLSDEPPTIPIDYFTPSQTSAEPEIGLPPIGTRGVGWVLQWAAALAVIFIAASVLIQFASGLSAEHTLARAAQAGAMEATLPRATYQSVMATIERRLIGYPRLVKQLHVSLEQNESLVQQQFSQHENDRFSVTLWAPSSSVAPDWLRPFMAWTRDSRIQARAQSQVPGRKLALGAGLPTPPKW